VIDIVIPVYGQKAMLEQCLTALQANTTPPHRIIIADDCSPDEETRAYLKLVEKMEGVILIRSKKNHGFPANVNHALSSVTSEFFVLLNSDTKPCTGWLTPLLEEMEDPQVAVVGSKLLYPREKVSPLGNTLQHCGVARDWLGRPYHMWRGLPKNLPAACKRRELNCVTFACALIRKSVWDEVGGLDEGYTGGQFEDVDFCWTVRKMGYKVVYTPYSILWHYEHGSGEEFARQTCEPNMERLRHKWPNIGSDEYLFTDILGPDPTAMRDSLAQFIHQVRSDAGAFDRPQRDESFVVHGRRIAKVPVPNLPITERDRTYQWADDLIKLLGGAA